MPPSSSLPAAAGQPFHPETVAALIAARQQFPDAPFLTLGQTVLWDEPIKAALCRVISQLELSGELLRGAKIVAGVHDTDYFAKLAGLVVRDSPFVVLRHNDGDTRGLWSAAGEISALLGAEIVPARAQFTRDGVAFARAAAAYPGGSEALLNQETDAPGWRAIVHTEPRPLLAAEVRCSEIAPTLLEELRWAFRHSLRSMGCEDDLEAQSPCSSREVARQLLSWVEEFIALSPSATLSELYRHLIPRIWSLVGNGGACEIATTASMDLFRFNGRTASLPRFRFVDLFLNPATRDLARRSYDEAVRGSGIYTLEGFGPGALPFDVVIPGRGRGTLRLLNGSLSIETEEPIEICENCDPDSVGRLAAILEARFGEDVVLIGKAVSLISMLAAEFIIVFHEKASSYTSRTQQMNAEIRSHGIELPLHPILRLQHAALDALEGVPARLHLPAYLAKAFGSAEISASDLATGWKDTVRAQEEKRARLREIKSVKDLLKLLAETDWHRWTAETRAFETAGAVLKTVRAQTLPLEREVAALRERAHAASVQALGIERAKGDHFRTTVAPLKDRLAQLLQEVAQRHAAVDAEGNALRLSKAERALRLQLSEADEASIGELRRNMNELAQSRAQFDREIAECRARSRQLQSLALEVLQRKLALEKSQAVVAARREQEVIANRAELARLLQVRDAIWVCESLRYINYRPTAWWLPMVSPDGRWFDQLAQRMKGRLEEV